MSKQQKWFNLEVKDIADKLDTDLENGLSKEQSKKRIEKYGYNELPEGETVPEWKKFLHHFHDILIYVLFVAAIITFLLGHHIDTIVIVAVAIVNATIGYFQESKAEQALEDIKSLLSAEAKVLHDGERTEVEAKELVPGDIVSLKAGDKIPADIRLFQASNLKVEESALTGESSSVDKSTDVLEEDASLGDRVNMVFSSTSVAAGSALGMVVETGEYTEIGKINTSISEVEEVKTPLLEQTDKLGKMISIAIVGIAILTFAYGYFSGNYYASELLLYVIGLAVAAIPEGLPAILSIILSIGVREMANKNAIVKSLPSVETLGAVSVICSDKTGTLTKNEMTVTSVILKDQQYSVTGTGYAPEGEIQYNGERVLPSEDHSLFEFLTIVKTVNDTHLRKNDEDQWTISGEPTEGCLITLAEKSGETIERHESIDKIPFDSSYKYMASLIELEGERVILVKGAPDRLFELCFDYDQQEEKSYWEKNMLERAKQGERLIGAAIKKVDSNKEEIDHEDLSSGLTLVGLAGIIDPPREEAIEAIKSSKEAGIRVKMITGDHKETAMAIGKQIGIGDGEKALEGRDLDKMSEEELKEAVLEYDIYARTSPENKVDLVKALQDNGLVTAMTGDGVNDAPALKRSDIGVAMGIKGTEVAKDSSEMVLADDNFQTIYDAVREGRLVYDNLKKTILFILPTNGAEAFLTFASIILGLNMPLTPIQILWINMMTSVTISLALAFEKLEPGTMKKKPRQKKTRLLSNYYIFRIIFVSVLVGGGVLWMNTNLMTNGYDQEVINTVTVQAIVLSQIFHLFNCRNETEFAFKEGFFSNKMAFIVSAALIVVQVGITYLPFMNSFLGTVPIELQYWGIPVLIGIAVFVIVEIEKWITRTIKRNRQEKSEFQSDAA